MDEKYCLIVKTGESEIRALENTDKDRCRKIFPLIELTRGRKKTRDGIASYPFGKRLDKLKKVFEGQCIAIDVTGDEDLSSQETENLFVPQDGYKNWLWFLESLKQEGSFSEIVPTILFNFDDPNYQENLKAELHSLEEQFHAMLYRCSIEDEGCYDDIELIQNTIGNGTKLYVVIDCEYVPQAMQNNVAEKCLRRIKNIESILKNSYEIIICSTSYPKNVSELGDVETDTFSMSEIGIYNSCKEEFPELIYGDYGSINPIRNDTVVMARGWIPRIDVPTETSIYYCKKRRPRGVTSYAGTYILVAQKVKKHTDFPHDLDDVWGIQQINICASEYVPSSSPSFWISVRMNIHIAQQLKRLN